MADSPTVTCEVIAEQDVSPELDLAIRELLCRCFPADRDAFASCRAWHDSWPEFTVVARQADVLLAHTGIVVRPVRCGASCLAVAGVQNFCVAPSHRGTGLSRRLMEAAMEEACRRHIKFGLLFCVPELQRTYAALGWRTIPSFVAMLDERGKTAPLPGKNIAMVRELADVTFPPGDLHLQGRDW